jgi:hypothetical protein
MAIALCKIVVNNKAGRRDELLGKLHAVGRDGEMEWPHSVVILTINLYQLLL